MKQIQTCLWFDSEGKGAAKFYISIFRNSRIERVVRMVVQHQKHRASPRKA